MLFDKADLPRDEKLGFAVLDWVEVDGGVGIRIDSCRDIDATSITDADTIGEIKIFTPPGFEDLNDGERARIESNRDGWSREYEENAYCRYESRQDLNQRYQDIITNTQVLKSNGKIGLTPDEMWHRLGHHVISEMHFRGEPPTASNLDPRVKTAHPFFDGELCRKAAAVVAAPRDRS